MASAVSKWDGLTMKWHREDKIDRWESDTERERERGCQARDRARHNHTLLFKAGSK